MNTSVLRLAEDTFVVPAWFPQQKTWLEDPRHSDNPIFNYPLLVRLRGPLNEAALERSLHEITRRHEVLRSLFRITDGELVQVVLAAQGPVRYAGGDDDLVVAGIMVQQTLKTGHQHHEQTHTLLPAQPPQRIGQLSRQHGAFPCAAIERARRSGKVRWQMLKAGRAVDLLIPVRQPGFQFFSLQLALLPPDVIAVLIGDVRQG